MVPIRGRVLYNGKPLQEGTIVYLPKDASVGRQASGGIQADGTFELTTIKKGDGAKIGEYRIAVYVYAPHPGEPGRGDNESGPAPVIERGFKIPKIYANAVTSGLEDSVTLDHPGFREYKLTD